MRYLVFAGNVKQFYWWCSEFGFDVNFWKYIPDSKSIYGYCDTYLYLVGTYWEKDCFCNIRDYCDSHNIALV